VNGILRVEDTLGDPLTDRVRAARQEVRKVGVQAFDALAGPADTAPRFGSFEIRTSLARVRLVCPPQVDAKVRVDGGFVLQALDPALRLQRADPLDGVGAGQPVEGREGMAGVVVGLVADDERVAVGAAGDDGEASLRWAPQLRGDGGEVSSGGDRRGDAVCGGAGLALAALVLDRALEVDLALFGLPHEPLQLLFELRVGTPAAFDARLRVLHGLDREVDLAVLFDGHDLGGDLVAEVEVLLDAADVVAIDLGDVDEANLAPVDLDERPIGRDASHLSFDDPTDFDVSDVLASYLLVWPSTPKGQEA
jgi:hypothetical protein